MNSVRLLAGVALGLMLFAPGVRAQTPSADSKPPEGKPSETKIPPETYQTFYLANLAQQNDLNDIQTDLRNMFPKARLYAISSQNAISMRGTPEDVQLAQKMISDLDRPRKTYRLTYTITETEGGTRTGTRQLNFVLTPAMKTSLRKGIKVPVFTGETSAESKTQSTPVQYVGAQVKYQDVGLFVQATADEIQNGARLRLWSRVSQSSLAEDKSGLGAQDPIIDETVLEGISTLVLGKPLSLGSFDLPGSARKQQIEVVLELVQ
jgi:type II secretory pathway component GspD/PulD (secretin)